MSSVSGLWFTPLREALDAFVDTVQERVTGVVRLKLFKGECSNRRTQTPRRRATSTADARQPIAANDS